jgi:hypothetical protein
LGLLWGLRTYKTQKHNRRLVADLQVKQILLPGDKVSDKGRQG